MFSLVHFYVDVRQLGDSSTQCKLVLYGLFYLHPDCCTPT